MTEPGAAPPLVQSRTLGRWQVHAIHAGGQRLDGGAMFGVVPKPLWERRIQPDARNRIPLAMRCLLVEHDVGPILIDTGAGNKEDAKFHDIYGVENRGEGGRTRLEDGLREIGVRPEDVEVGAEGVSGRVAVVENAGNEGFVHVDVAGDRVVARLPAERLPETDGDVRVRIPAERVYRFDRETGKLR